MRYPNDLEPVERQARLARGQVTEDQDDRLEMASYYAGVEEALIWAASKGTSEGLSRLVHDAEQRKEQEDALDEQQALIDAAKELLTEPTEHVEYTRGVIALITEVTGLSHQDGGPMPIVTERLGLSPEEHAGLYR
jgi:hypothetical protein